MQQLVGYIYYSCKGRELALEVLRKQATIDEIMSTSILLDSASKHFWHYTSLVHLKVQLYSIVAC